MFYILYISTVLDLHKELSHHYEAYTEKAGYDSHWNILYGMQDIRMWVIIYFIYRKYVVKIAHLYAAYREIGSASEASCMLCKTYKCDSSYFILKLTSALPLCFL